MSTETKAAVKAETTKAAPKANKANKAKTAAVPKPKAAAPKKPKAKKVNQKGKKIKPKKKVLKFTIDLSDPVEDGIMDPNSFEKYLHDRIKVKGKAGQLGTAVRITREQTKLTVASIVPFSKKYVKYLTKKYLKKQQLRDWLRVVSQGKNAYKLKYFNIHDQEEEAEE
jgi:large subunit ribosomal protein L22e